MACLVFTALVLLVWLVSLSTLLGVSILISGKAKQRNNRIPKGLLGSKSHIGYRRLYFLSVHGKFYFILNVIDLFLEREKERERKIDV